MTPRSFSTIALCTTGISSTEYLKTGLSNCPYCHYGYIESITDPSHETINTIYVWYECAQCKKQWYEIYKCVAYMNFDGSAPQGGAMRPNIEGITIENDKLNKVYQDLSVRSIVPYLIRTIKYLLKYISDLELPLYVDQHEAKGERIENENTINCR